MNDEGLKAKLLRGSQVEICEIPIKNYTLGELEDYGFDKYRHLISLTVLKPKDVLDKNVNVEDIEIYDICCALQPLKQWMIDMLFFLTELTFEYNSIFNEFVAYKHTKRYQINKENYKEIFKLIRIMYALEVKKSKVDIDIDMAVDEETRELAKEFAEFKKEQNSKKGKGVTLLGIMRGVATSGTGYTWNDVWNMTLYCLIETYSGIQMHDNYRYTMTGIYSGAISSKDVNMDDINYAKDID